MKSPEDSLRTVRSAVAGAGIGVLLGLVYLSAHHDHGALTALGGLLVAVAIGAVAYTGYSLVRSDLPRSGHTIRWALLMFSILQARTWGTGTGSWCTLGGVTILLLAFRHDYRRAHQQRTAHTDTAWSSRAASRDSGTYRAP